jgi:chromosome segregation ATPase
MKFDEIKYQIRAAWGSIDDDAIPDDDKRTAALELAAMLLDWEHKQRLLPPRAEALRGSYWKKMAEKTIGPRLENMLANADAAKVQLRADIKAWQDNSQALLANIAIIQAEIETLQEKSEAAKKELEQQGLNKTALEKQKNEILSGLGEIQEVLKLHGELQEVSKKLDDTDKQLELPDIHNFCEALQKISEQYRVWQRENSTLATAIAELQAQAITEVAAELENIGARLQQVDTRLSSAMQQQKKADEATEARLK